jgi:two-component sensor histidine kinase
MDGLKLAHAVHERWPQIKIILVSGQITPSSDEKPENSRFFGKPIDSKEMIAELQDMIGAGTLEVVSGQAGLTVNPTRPSQSVAEETLTAENDSLRLLLEQAGIDAKLLLAQAGIDAKEREAADKLQKLVLGELHHRIKNTLATVSAIASQSLRTATSVQHAQQAIEGRLLALGRAHDLLMQVSWASAGLEMTIRNATEPYDNKGVGRFAVSGPEVDMGSGAVIALAMTLNELCTNATKFGALSDPSGIVKVDWTIDQASQQLTLSWIESGGALVNPPVRRSFGTRMMESLGRQLNGTVRLAYPPSGFIYTLEVPIASLNK